VLILNLGQLDMWSFIQDVFKELVAQGWPLDVLIGIGIFLLAIYIFLYFKRENKVMIDLFTKQATILETHSAVLVKTNNLITKESEHIAKENSLIQELHNSVTALSFNIESLVNVDERMTEQQAIILYEVMMQDLFKDIKEFYYDTNNWLNTKDGDRLDDPLHQQIHMRVDLIFDSLLSDLKSKLANFKFKEHYLTNYINDNFKIEFNHVKVHIHSILSTESNGIKEYLKAKQERFNTDFQLYLKGKS
jgi:hypothetical protein